MGAPGTGAATVDSAVGLGLFDFGFRDGPAADARLQHCLGVTVLPDGSVAVADTYNGAVRRYDPATDEVTTLTRGLAEPSDVLLDTTHEDPVLVLHHLGDEDGARELGEQLVEAHRPDARLLVCPLPPVLAAHVGLGARAAVVEGPSARPVLHPVPPGTAPGGD